ncbi:hypothetical protein F2A31_07460 [Acinetobacter suaedae]|uniref:Adaptor protein ClpS core domain-containing protein n=1 Tax=Acinetobacter suaedae TaxID=2609668 RepID=A0A5P1UV96_9GAMM|nr:hypothetical protein F2A31_07460 [Acinetobacter sp. C16S1]
MVYFLFVIEFLQQYFVLNLDRYAQLMLTVDYEAKRIINVYEITVIDTPVDQSITVFSVKD